MDAVVAPLSPTAVVSAPDADVVLVGEAVAAFGELNATSGADEGADGVACGALAVSATGC